MVVCSSVVVEGKVVVVVVVVVVELAAVAWACLCKFNNSNGR